MKQTFAHGEKVEGFFREGAVHIIYTNQCIYRIEGNQLVRLTIREEKGD